MLIVLVFFSEYRLFAVVSSLVDHI